MSILISGGSYEELQGFLKQSTLAIAIVRNLFHLFTSAVATYTYLSTKYLCDQCGSGAQDGSDVIFAFVFLYFVTDISSLPQEIYYIWATTSSDLDLSLSLTQAIGFGLASINIIGVLAMNTGLFIFNLN